MSTGTFGAPSLPSDCAILLLGKYRNQSKDVHSPLQKQKKKKMYPNTKTIFCCFISRQPPTLTNTESLTVNYLNLTCF